MLDFSDNAIRRAYPWLVTRDPAHCRVSTPMLPIPALGSPGRSTSWSGGFPPSRVPLSIDASECI